MKVVETASKFPNDVTLTLLDRNLLDMPCVRSVEDTASIITFMCFQVIYSALNKSLPQSTKSIFIDCKV